uniref:Peptidase S74 domain-containing protein n=1 Tax=Globisporangium ultimum (strain ATCC 200006 / CBS 805.95 / DAOM BR144) TaxID=431595 RepID=K3X8J2_GLOUD
MITHVPAQFTEVIYPSDRRIKTNIADIDEDDILQRLQTLEIKSYRYSKEWRELRGIPDTERKRVDRFWRGVDSTWQRVIVEWIEQPVCGRLDFRGEWHWR